MHWVHCVCCNVSIILGTILLLQYVHLSSHNSMQSDTHHHIGTLKEVVA